MEETVAKINPGLLDTGSGTGHLDKALSQHFYITFFGGYFFFFLEKSAMICSTALKKRQGGGGDSTQFNIFPKIHHNSSQ